MGGSPVLQPLSLSSSGTPKGVDFTAVRNLLLSIEGVEALHSLHIWALTTAQPILSVHIAIGEWQEHSGWVRERQPGSRGHPRPTGLDDARYSRCQCFGSDPMLSTGHLSFI